MQITRRSFLFLVAGGAAGCDRRVQVHPPSKESPEQQLQMPRTVEQGYEPPQAGEVGGDTARGKVENVIADIKQGNLLNFEYRFGNRVTEIAKNYKLGDEQILRLKLLIFNARYQVQAGRRTVLVTFQGQFVDKQGAEVPLDPLSVSIGEEFTTNGLVEEVCRQIIRSKKPKGVDDLESQ